MATSSRSRGEEYRQTLDSTRSSTFPRRWRARWSCSARWASSREPLPARVALSPPAGRRVPGHQRRAVAPGVAARAVVARGPRRRAGSAARADDLRRRRSQAVDLRLPRRRRRRPAAGRRRIAGSGPTGDVRRAISPSFRAVPPLLAFTNDVCSTPSRRRPTRADAFRYEEHDRFPVRRGERVDGEPALGARSPAPTADACAHAVAAEIARLLAGTVRDRQTGVRAPAAPGDIAHPVPLARGPPASSSGARGARHPSYVYKGLGFFDADEIKDVVAVLRWLGAIRRPICAPPRFSDRASSGCPIARCAAARAARGRRRSRRRRRPQPSSMRTIAAVLARVAGLRARMDRAGRSRAARRVAGSRARRVRRTATSSPARAPSRRGRTSRRCAAGAPHPEPRLRDAGARHRSPRSAVGRRRVERRDRRGGRRQPDDRPRRQGPRVPGRLRRQPRQGRRRPRAPIRFPAPADDTPVVAIGDFRSEADEDAAAREREETKRLLYVAVTRARDRLYSRLHSRKASSSSAGRIGRSPAVGFSRFVPSRPCRSRLDPRIDPWGQSPISSGRWSVPTSVHRFRVCPVPEDDGPAPAREEGQRPLQDFRLARTDGIAEFASLGRAWIGRRRFGCGTRRCSVKRPHSRLSGPSPPRTTAGLCESRTPSVSGRRALAARRTRAMAARIWRRVLERRSIAYLALVDRADIRTLFSGGRRWHEVPVTLVDNGNRVRGAIDTLILLNSPEGTAPRAIVLEFKTGAAEPWHQAQIDGYVAAAREVFPTAEVEGSSVRDSH